MERRKVYECGCNLWIYIPIEAQRQEIVTVEWNIYQMEKLSDSLENLAGDFS